MSAIDAALNLNDPTAADLATEENEEKLYTRCRLSVWLLRLLPLLFRSGASLESDFFNFLRKNVAIDFKEVFRELPDELGSGEPEARRKAWLKARRDFLSETEPYCIARKLEGVLENFPSFKDPLLLAIGERLRRNIGSGEKPPDSRRAADTLADLFGLDAPSVDICEFFYLCQFFDYDELFFGEFYLNRPRGRRLLAAAMNLSLGDLLRRLDILGRVGLMGQKDGDGLYLKSELAAQLWSLPPGEEPRDIFCRRLSGDCLPLSAFALPAEAVAYARALLAEGGERPVHILLYGPPGTGKTTFARSLASDLGLQAWAVAPAAESQGGDRRAALTACAALAARQNRGLTVADEAEDLLRESGGLIFSAGKSMNKSWITEFMEKPGQRIIWAVNHLDQIDPAIRRRFNFSLHFEELGRRERRELWRGLLSAQDLTEQVTPTELETLVREHPAPSAAVMEMAVRQARRIGSGAAPAITHCLEAYETLMRNGRPALKKVAPPPLYTLDGVTAELPAAELLSRLRRLDELRRREELPAGFGSLLFYGPPGTGKTALARHLAEELGKELFLRRASDILDPFVGGTERNLAAAFRQAEREDAVLVFDEADSFLYRRDRAERSWEITQVNEFLTALEECRCFCICTSNRREELDSAASRRFAFKVPFLYAGPEQALALYEALLAPLAGEPLSGADRSRLMAMARLTPGDFHAARARLVINSDTPVSHDELFRELDRELELKTEPEARRIGFF